MGQKKCCEIFFQNSKKEKDMADETVESLAIKFGMILNYLEEIKQRLNDFPCDELAKEIAENKFEIKHLKESVAKLEKEKDEEIYPRLRKAEESGTIKIKWVITVILSGIISAGFAIMVYRMTRGA